jgi:uncharacterized protein YqgC (DUF456 family)
LCFKLIGFSIKEIFLSALLFSFPFTILIAIAKILYEKEIWDAERFSLVVLLTVLTGIVYPLIIKILFTDGKTLN